MHLSHTQISMILRCPRQWQYRYEYGIKQPTTHHLTLGSAYHKSLETNFVQKKDTEQDLPLDVVQDAFSDDWEKRLQSEDVVFVDAKPGEVKDRGIKLVSAYHTRVAPTVQPFMVEEPFSIPLQKDWDLNGIIDLMTYDGVVDHKTASKSWTQDAADKELQPTMYLLASRELGLPFKEFEYHVAVSKGTPEIQRIKTTRGEQEMEWYLELARQAIKVIQNGVFMPAAPGSWWCGSKWCAYTPMCRPWTRE